MISQDAWDELTAETPRGDASDRHHTGNPAEELFDVDDFASAHSSVSTPNEDDLHSARSLSSDGGGSRIVLNDGEDSSSFSSPRELHIKDTADMRALSLHVTATLCWREHLTLCGRIGQSLHPVALSGPILAFPTLNSALFDAEAGLDKRFPLPSPNVGDCAAGVGGVRRPASETEMTTSDDDRDKNNRDSRWDNFEALARAEFEEGDARSCHSSKAISFHKGISCRLSALAPAAVEMLVEYLSPFLNEAASVAELPLPASNDASPSHVARASPIRVSPKPSQSESLHALLFLFEHAHKAVRSASFSSPDAMLLNHTLKSSFSVSVPFIALDIYPPPPILPERLSSKIGLGVCGFAAIRFVASGLKYKFASQINVSCMLHPWPLIVFVADACCFFRFLKLCFLVVRLHFSLCLRLLSSKLESLCRNGRSSVVVLSVVSKYQVRIMTYLPNNFPTAIFAVLVDSQT